jgi:DNA-binding transcriptional ArsR family regulator
MLRSMPKHPTREEVADACLEMLDTGFFRALCEPVRVEILRYLIVNGRSDVNTVSAAMPQDRSVIARHLQLMERAGLLQAQSEGRHTFYEIDGPSIVSRMTNVTKALSELVPMCCPRPGP